MTGSNPRTKSWGKNNSKANTDSVKSRHVCNQYGQQQSFNIDHGIVNTERLTTRTENAKIWDQIEIAEIPPAGQPGESPGPRPDAPETDWCMVESMQCNLHGRHLMVEYILWIVAVASFAIAYYASLHYHNLDG